MRGVYFASDRFASTGNVAILALTAAANVSCEVLRAEITSNDETNIMAEAGIYRCTSVSGGTALTEKPMEPGDANATAVAVSGATSITPTGQEADPLAHGYAPMTGGWIYAPTPEERIVLGGGDTLVIELTETITSANIIGSITWREIG